MCCWQTVLVLLVDVRDYCKSQCFVWIESHFDSKQKNENGNTFSYCFELDVWIVRIVFCTEL